MKKIKTSEFASFTRKEFTHILRDRRTLLILLFTPIVLILLFSYAISTEIRNVRVAVLLPDYDPAALQLVEKINASDYFIVTEKLQSPSQIEETFRRGKADLVLSFEGNLSGDLLSADGSGLSIIADASNPNNATAETMYLGGVIGDWVREKLSAQMSGAAGPLSAGMPQESTQGATATSGAGMSPESATLATASSGSISSNVRMLYNPRLQSSYNFVPGIVGLILMLICALMTSVSIVREKETGTMEVLLVSPVKPLTIILAKMIPYFTMSCIDLGIVLLMSRYVLGLPMSGSLFWILVSSVIYIILSLSIGLLVSNIVKNQVTASLVCAIGLLFPMLMLSGMIFPIESMPAVFQWCSAIIPARWYIVILRRLMIQGTGVVYILKELAILIAMALTLMAVALKKFNDRLE